ncbi:hypothetical protein NLI96_g4379 [Meripilus lineatus]|uniref:Peptidase metallopeptidase domain-containing protein n=1 Tax=Meripilus lineatus TaxID=2056292 RepID=A0AAD5V717_9APHY|nr:hypothetical protein NLI96_g4379 [Physisporinus lineatus]
MSLTPKFVKLLCSLLTHLKKCTMRLHFPRSEGPLYGALLRGTLWEHNQEITFSFHPLSGNENQRSKTQSLVEECFMYTNLTTTWVEDGDGMIRISFDNDLDSSSPVGRGCYRIPQRNATTNLQSIDPNTDQPSPEEAFIILHECGHICGLIHEHMLPSRPDHFNFIDSEIQKRYGGFGWSTNDIKKNVTRFYKQRHLENCSSFDPKYEFPAFLTYEGVGTTLNTKLSDVDKAVLTMNYARLKPHPRATNWTVSFAADILGVDGELREKIVSSGDPRDIRKYYTEWSTQQMESLGSECIVS